MGIIDPDFFEKVISKTRSKIFQWKETAAEDVFRLTLKNGMILIQKEEEHYILLIFDTRNREADRANTASDSSIRSYLKDL